MFLRWEKGVVEREIELSESLPHNTTTGVGACLDPPLYAQFPAKKGSPVVVERAIHLVSGM
jgi:hypothetical protein